MDSFETTSDAYLAVLATLLDEPDFLCSPRGMPCRELMNWQFVVERPSAGPLVTRSEARDAVMADYLAKEVELYLAGEMRASIWAERASRFWLKLANPDGTINSNYGQLIFRERSLPGGLTPWEWTRESLRRDPDTRQAYARVALPRHQEFGVRDQVCTLHLNFLLRGGRLHGTVVMRSNDAVRGLAYDMPWFCKLLLQMAEEVGSEVGTYTHLAHSLHLYEKDRVVAEEMLGRIVVR